PVAGVTSRWTASTSASSSAKRLSWPGSSWSGLCTRCATATPGPCVGWRRRWRRCRQRSTTPTWPPPRSICASWRARRIPGGPSWPASWVWKLGERRPRRTGSNDRISGRCDAGRGAAPASYGAGLDLGAGGRAGPGLGGHAVFDRDQQAAALPALLATNSPGAGITEPLPEEAWRHQPQEISDELVAALGACLPAVRPPTLAV